MIKIKTLDEISREVFNTPFNSLSQAENKQVIVAIQRNNIEIAKLELKYTMEETLNK